jgi:hypothetical protein
MTWTKLGDEFYDECWTLTDSAFRLHVEALVWSNKKLTDGQLAKDEMLRWARHPEAAEELVSVGWWEDCGAHYLIIHHIGYQRAREDAVKQSTANSSNAKKRWAKAKAAKPQDVSSCESQCESHNESQCNMDRTGQDWTGTEEQFSRAQKPSAADLFEDLADAETFDRLDYEQQRAEREGFETGW